MRSLRTIGTLLALLVVLMPTFALAAPVSPPATAALSRPITGAQIRIALDGAMTIVDFADNIERIASQYMTPREISEMIDVRNLFVLVTEFNGYLQQYILPNRNISITTNAIDRRYFKVTPTYATTPKGNQYPVIKINTIVTRPFLAKATGTWNYSGNHNYNLHITAYGGCDMYSYGVFSNCTIRPIKTNQGVEGAIITISGGSFDGTYFAAITGTQSSSDLLLIDTNNTNKYYYFSPN